MNSTPEVILNKIFTHTLHGFVNYVKAYYLETYIKTAVSFHKLSKLIKMSM